MKSSEQVGQEIEEEFAKLREQIKKPNILIAGATGVGKSSLINQVFGADVAQIGVGKPITQNIEKFEPENIDICIYDSPGYEIGDDKHKAFSDEVIQLVTKPSEDFESQIHLVWYCISALGSRVSDNDLYTINKIKEAQRPLAVIFTKADHVSEEEMICMHEVVSKISNVQIFETSTIAHKYSQHENLVEWSHSKLPESLHYAFIKSQSVSLKQKWQQASKIIVQHTAGAVGVGFTPIPFSDAPLLVTNQLGMVVRILDVYNLKNIENLLTTSGVVVIAGKLISMVGIQTAASLMKLFPGIGTFLGGLITGSVASVITASIGFGIAATCHGIWTSVLSGDTKEAQEKVDSFIETAARLAKAYSTKNPAQNNDQKEILE